MNLKVLISCTLDCDSKTQKSHAHNIDGDFKIISLMFIYKCVTLESLASCFIYKCVTLELLVSCLFISV